MAKPDVKYLHHGLELQIGNVRQRFAKDKKRRWKVTTKAPKRVKVSERKKK